LYPLISFTTRVGAKYPQTRNEREYQTKRAIAYSTWENFGRLSLSGKEPPLGVDHSASIAFSVQTDVPGMRDVGSRVEQDYMEMRSHLGEEIVLKIVSLDEFRAS
jgi:hypothetical protein